MGDYDDQLLRTAILHYKSEEFETALNYLERAITLVDDVITRDEARRYLSLINEKLLITDPEKKRAHLKAMIGMDPSNQEWRKQLAILDGKLKPDQIIDPDAIPAPSDENESVQADRFTCPKCGGHMTFAPDGQNLVCEYCGYGTLQAEPEKDDQDFLMAMLTGKAHSKSVSMQTFRCQGCSADFLLPPQAKTSTCTYCGSNYVIQGKDRELIEPDAIIPMAIAQKQAMQNLRDWAVKHGINPDGKAHAPRGMYMPAWTFELTGVVPWFGTTPRSDMSYIVGAELLMETDLPVYAVTRMEKRLSNFIDTYDLTSMVPYHPQYLAGWAAEVYDITLSDASLRMREKTRNQAQKNSYRKNPDVRFIHFSGVTDLIVSSFKLVFLPLWMTEYTFEGTTYLVLVNGATGEVHGEKPRVQTRNWIDKLLGL